MKIYYAVLFAVLLNSAAFAQTSVIATYVDVLPQNNAGEGGELQLWGSNSYNTVILDNYFGNARIFGLSSGKQFQVLGGTIYSDGVGANYFEGRVGIGSSLPRQKLEVGASSNPAVNIHDFSTAELTIGVNESLFIAQFNTNSGGFRFVAGQDGTSFPGGGTEIARFSASGNVGIGTDTPSQKLDVAGNVRVGGDLVLGGNPGGGNKLLLTNGSDIHFIRANAWWTEFVSHPNEGWKFISHSENGSYEERMRILAGSGNVGIGTTNPTHKLAVNGTIKAKEVIVETTGWSDYVFADDYALAPLAEVEAHIKANKHLPGIPAAAQVGESGVSLGDMQARLLAKIEELTLHQIAQEKRIAALEAENNRLKTLPR